jgi:hypothetical protein
MSTDIITIPDGQGTTNAPSPAALCTVSLVGKFYFVENDRSLKVLIVLCRGILDVDGNQLLDVTSEP